MAVSRRALLTMAALMFVTVSCSSGFEPTPDQTPVPTSVLLIDESELPAGWSAGKPRPTDEKLSQIDDVVVVFQSPKPYYLATQWVWEFRSAGLASNGYVIESRTQYGTADLIEPWTTPDDFKFQSTLASKSRFACTPYHVDKVLKKVIDRRCVFIAQYKQFLVMFLSYASPELLSASDITKIIQVMEDKVKAVL